MTEGADLRFDHLPLGMDPSHRRITGIVQDDLGFLWIGTDDGLKRYDGYRIRDYRHDPKNPNSLPDSYIVPCSRTAPGSFGLPRGVTSMCTTPRPRSSRRSAPDQRSKERLTGSRRRNQSGSRGHDLVIDRQGPVRGGPCRGRQVPLSARCRECDSLSSNVVRSTVESQGWIVLGCDHRRVWIRSIARAIRSTRRAAFDMAHSV